MPPLVPRKRLKSDSPNPEPPPKRAATRRTKESVFQTLDAPPTISRSLSQTKALFEQEDDDSSALSDLESSDDEFEHVISNAKGDAKADGAESSADEEWEDALGEEREAVEEPVISGDIQINFSSLDAQSDVATAQAGKKGISKLQRQRRYRAHCMDVQFLMFHNWVRNSWLQETETQKSLVNHLNTGCWKEIARYWRDSGIANGPDRLVEGVWSQDLARKVGYAPDWKDTETQGVREFTPTKVRTDAKGKGKEPQKSKKEKTPSKQRDWGADSDRLEPDTPNLSAGDPLIRLLKYLSTFWKNKFKITAPCLRKQGYLSPAALKAEVNAWKKDPTDAKNFGERIENREAFRQLAQKCEGSRDVGQQLFTSMLRGLGIEARLVASLQPLGFGFSQVEEGKAKDLQKVTNKASPKNKSSAKASPVKPLRKEQAVDGSKTRPINLSDGESSGLSSPISSSSELECTPGKSIFKSRRYGDELPYPTYWTEAISHLTHTPVCVSSLPRPVIATPSSPDTLAAFYSRGTAADKAKQVFAYIIAFSSDGTAKDVTTRYLPKQQWPGKTKGFRLPPEKVPVYNKHGKVNKWEEWDWFKSVIRPYSRAYNERQPWDEIEDAGDLVPKKPQKPKHMDEEGGKETLQGYKDSALYVLERHLRREEALKTGAKIVRYFTTGKGDKEKKEPVYYRKDVVACKTVESWHKEGRAVKEGEQPLKYVPMRAVTVTRKREIEEREREEGGKVMQGLYSEAQTDWIIPDPIEDGKIPRNAFGNIDVYVPTMVPKGAVHIPKKGTARICKKLGIDYAEACTGFEFGKQRAVPVLTGVVVAAENKDLVIDAWKVDQAERAKKEKAKKEAVVFRLWKKFFYGLRVVDRMRQEYGDEAEFPDQEPSGTTAAPQKSEWEAFKSHEGDFEGGFLREEGKGEEQLAGGHVLDEDITMADLPSSQESVQHSGTLTVDHGEELTSHHNYATAARSHQTPTSLHAALQDHDNDSGDLDTHSDAMENFKPKRKPASNTKATRGKNTSADQQKRKSAKTSHQKAVTEESSVLTAPESSAKSSGPDESESEQETRKPARRRKPLEKPAPTRRLPRRQAAMKSNAKVRSHYFGASDGDTDL